MNKNFDPSVKAVLVTEAGFVNNPHDPGGATNRGITQEVYDEWRHDSKLPKQSVRAIGIAETIAIYRKLYWITIRGDLLPSGVDYCVFDFGVNSGVSRAIKYLQRTLCVVDDGQIGPATITAMNTHPTYDLIDGICDLRLDFLQHLKTFDEFGHGWTSRVSKVREDAKDMVDVEQ